ncbi:hypothetical protein GN958_ATG14144 [Phytophthora infestans]|uniref:Uncharacterized protein n=1 Tax=Phytophthora infestans TaxID=4787 RepID=A0A8S9UCF2_PHYIN|nr:hypothetical protein GN958_ATG14144 [Phytophthora infestans]
MSLSAGDYVLLHPEDVPALQGQFQYAEVVSARRTTVKLRSIGREPEQQYSVGRAVARRRKVDASEATGSGVGEWMRKAVSFVHRGYTYYGQVVSYDGTHLLVKPFTGQKRVAVDEMTSEVYQVVAMIMGTRPWSNTAWPARRLEAVHDDLIDCILAGKDGLPVLPTDLKEHVPQEISEIVDRQVSWVDTTSGSARIVFLSYVLRYIFFADGVADHPQQGEALGNSFCDEPVQRDGGQGSPRTDFFDPLVDDDDGPVDTEPQNSNSSGLLDGRPAQRTGLPNAIEANPQNAFVPGCSTSAEPERRSSDTGAAESQDLELIELISRHKPHLLGFRFLHQATCILDGGRDAEAAEGDHRRCCWSSNDLQALKDGILTVARTRARSPSTSGPNSQSLNSDFSVPPPPAPAPQSWSELGAAARSFAAYAQDTCDSVSVRLAITLVDFIAEVEGGGPLVEEDLPVLVWWINDGLEKYRNAVGRDIDSGGNSRIALIDRFSASNPELQGLVLSVLRERLLDGARSQPKAGSVEPRLQERFHAERKISKEVIECIPTRDEKEVCLHFLSKRGCSSKNPSVCTFRDRLHFWPSEIPSKVRVYIEEKLGGLRVKGSRALRTSKTTHRVVHCTKSKPSPTAASTANCVPHGQSEWFPHLTSPVPHLDVERCPRRTPTKRLDVHPARAIYEVRSLVPNPSIVQAILEKKLKAEERRRDLAISKVLSECEVSIGDVSRNETSPSTDSLDSSRIRAFSKLVRRRCYSLPELVELVRGQMTQDRRPNKALCPQRYELLLRGYRHQRLLQSIATTGICPGWLRPGTHQNKRPANHHSATRHLSAVIASIRKGQDACQYLVVEEDIAALWADVQISPFGAVAKKGVDPSVEVRLIHDLSFPTGDSTNDASDKGSFPNAHYTNVAAIARRIDECWELHPGVRSAGWEGIYQSAVLSSQICPLRLGGQAHRRTMLHLAEPSRGLWVARALTR